MAPSPNQSARSDPKKYRLVKNLPHVWVHTLQPAQFLLWATAAKIKCTRQNSRVSIASIFSKLPWVHPPCSSHNNVADKILSAILVSSGPLIPVSNLPTFGRCTVWIAEVSLWRHCHVAYGHGYQERALLPKRLNRASGLGPILMLELSMTRGEVVRRNGALLCLMVWIRARTAPKSGRKCARWKMMKKQKPKWKISTHVVVTLPVVQLRSVVALTWHDSA